MTLQFKQKNIIARELDTAETSLQDLAEGMALHGITNGKWSLIDAIMAILEKTGTVERLIVSTWTAGRADISQAERLLIEKRIKSCNFLVDRSFQTRQPKYCANLRQAFGDDTIRVWNSHAKFVLFLGGHFPVLYITSANLNANKRIENFTAFGGGSIVGEYVRMVNKMLEIQEPGQGFEVPSVARPQTDQVLASMSSVIQGPWRKTTSEEIRRDARRLTNAETEEYVPEKPRIRVKPPRKPTDQETPNE